MKRPVTLVLASLLVSGSVFAGNGVSSQIASRVVGADKPAAVRHTSDRGNDHRGGNHPAPPSHGGGHDRRDGGKHHDNGGHHDSNNRNDHGRNDRNRYDNHRGNNHNNWNGHRGWDRPRSDWNNHPNYWDNRRHDRRDYARYRYSYGYYRAPHGYHYRVWHRGDYLPRAYYGSSYIVYDYAPYRLYAPPYGYHWVRVGNDVLLTALATGVVLDVLYNIWY